MQGSWCYTFWRSKSLNGNLHPSLPLAGKKSNFLAVTGWKLSLNEYKSSAFGVSFTSYFSKCKPSGCALYQNDRNRFCNVFP
jgi:hypothetical protein